jgi:hypothetical protein
MLTVLASTLACGSVAAALAQSAPAVRSVTANGTISCGSATGTMTFSPPLTAKDKSKTSLTYYPAQCTTTVTNLPRNEIFKKPWDRWPTVCTWTWNGGISCSIRNGWGGSPVIVTNTMIAVSKPHFVQTSVGDVGIVMDGTATGSFAGPAAVTLNTSTLYSQFEAELAKGGVSSLAFTSGTANVGG